MPHMLPILLQEMFSTWQWVSFNFNTERINLIVCPESMYVQDGNDTYEYIFTMDGTK